MGRLTTHVLNTAEGIPAEGMQIELHRLETGGPSHLKTVSTNADGRVDNPLLEGGDFTAGTYELRFHAGEYFLRRRLECPFLGVVPIRFTVAAPKENYHVPLVCSPWSYSTYRGS